MEIEDIHKNVKVLINSIPYNVDDVDFVKPGKGRAIYRLKLRNLLDDSTLDSTCHSGDKMDEAPITTHEMQYLYNDGEQYVFMNSETFEQLSLPGEKMGNKKYFLKEGTVVMMMMLGDRPIGVTIPNFVELKIVESAVSTKTDSVASQNKAAKLETGYVIGVPPFIKEGDVIKVDTRTGTYVERITGKK
ncbi:MAG: elongation factor P [Chloroflexi bacterium]|nr:elongation factor P [Chloroflexota bacterium]